MDMKEKIKALLEQISGVERSNIHSYYQFLQSIHDYFTDYDERHEAIMMLKKDAPDFGVSTAFVYCLIRTCTNIPYSEYKRLEKQAKLHKIFLTWSNLRMVGCAKLSDTDRDRICQEIVTNQYTERQVRQLVHECVKTRSCVSMKGWTRIPPNERFLDCWYVYVLKGHRYVDQLVIDKDTNRLMLGQNSVDFLLGYNVFFYKLPEFVCKGT